MSSRPMPRPCPAHYRGYDVTLRRGARDGYLAVAEQSGESGESERHLSTHLHTGVGAKERTIADILTQIDVERALEPMKRSHGG
jgi:hypothetical protein